MSDTNPICKRCAPEQGVLKGAEMELKGRINIQSTSPIAGLPLPGYETFQELYQCPICKNIDIYEPGD